MADPACRAQEIGSSEELAPSGYVSADFQTQTDRVTDHIKAVSQLQELADRPAPAASFESIGGVEYLSSFGTSSGDPIQIGYGLEQGRIVSIDVIVHIPDGATGSTGSHTVNISFEVVERVIENDEAKKSEGGAAFQGRFRVGQDDFGKLLKSFEKSSVVSGATDLGKLKKSLLELDSVFQESVASLPADADASLKENRLRRTLDSKMTSIRNSVSDLLPGSKLGHNLLSARFYDDHDGLVVVIGVA